MFMPALLGRRITNKRKAKVPKIDVDGMCARCGPAAIISSGAAIREVTYRLWLRR